MSDFNPFDLFFVAGPALRQIYHFGFRPKEEDFLEMTSEQYEKYYEQVGKTDEKVYLYLPKDPKEYEVVAGGHDVYVMTESDIDTMKRAWSIVENYCKKKGMENASDHEKLACAAAFLPSVFTENSQFKTIAVR